LDQSCQLEATPHRIPYVAPNTLGIVAARGRYCSDRRRTRRYPGSHRARAETPMLPPSLCLTTPPCAGKGYAGSVTAARVKRPVPKTSHGMPYLHDCGTTPVFNRAAMPDRI